MPSKEQFPRRYTAESGFAEAETRVVSKDEVKRALGSPALHEAVTQPIDISTYQVPAQAEYRPKRAADYGQKPSEAIRTIAEMHKDKAIPMDR